VSVNKIVEPFELGLHSFHRFLCSTYVDPT